MCNQPDCPFAVSPDENVAGLDICSTPKGHATSFSGLGSSTMERPHFLPSASRRIHSSETSASPRGPKGATSVAGPRTKPGSATSGKDLPWHERFAVAIHRSRMVGLGALITLCCLLSLHACDAVFRRVLLELREERE